MISGVFRGIIHIVENVIKTVLRMGKTAGVVLAGITAYSVKTGMSFDQMMSKVQAFSKINSKTSEEFKMLRQAAFEMGRTTEHTAVQSAAALVELAKGGLTARQQVEALTGVLNLATIGSVETTEAAGTMLGIMKAMGLEASELALVADKMAVAITSTKATVESLSEALSYSSNVAKLYNVPLSEVLTTLGLLSDASIEGSMSGTSYRRIMIMLGKDAAATAEEMEKLRQSTSEEDRGFLDDLEKASGILKKKFGVELLKANGDMESMGKIIGQMNKGMKDMGSVAKNAQLEQVFQVRGITSMGALLAQGEAAFKDLFHEIDTGLGRSERMREIMMDNLAGDVTKFRSAMSAVGISISDTLKDRLRAATTRMTSWLNDNEAQIAATFNRIYNFIEKWAVKIKNVFMAIVLTIKDDWQSGFSLLETVLIESMRAMATIAYHMGTYVGKELLNGLKQAYAGTWFEELLPESMYSDQRKLETWRKFGTGPPITTNEFPADKIRAAGQLAITNIDNSVVMRAIKDHLSRIEGNTEPPPVGSISPRSLDDFI